MTSNRTWHKTCSRFLLPTVLLVSAMTVIACAPPPAPTAAPAAPLMATVPAAAYPTSAPAATTAPTRAAMATAMPAAGVRVPVQAASTQRMIVKNAQMQLSVEKTDTAIDRLTGIVGDVGGYIVSTRLFTEQGVKAATVTFAVPVDRFEETLRRVRQIAVKVEQENASGQDVTDQYVDLDSQLRNLQATADRIREFLKKAQTVDEALKVNQQLSDVEQQIETIKGKMNYLSDRSAYSTLTVDIREPIPTPTPTPTSTPTPTATPAGWYPDRTMKQAVDTQTTMVHGLVELVIWLGVVLLPYVIVFGGGAWLVVLLLRRLGKWPPKSTSA